MEASLTRRLVAFGLDIIVLAIFSQISLSLGMKPTSFHVGGAVLSIGSVGALACLLCNQIVLVGLYGATIGKYLVAIKIERTNSQRPVGLLRAIGRVILICVFGILDWTGLILSRRTQRLSDKILCLDVFSHPRK